MPEQVCYNLRKKSVAGITSAPIQLTQEKAIEYGEHYNDQFSHTSYHNCATNTGKDPEGYHWLPSKYNNQNMPIHGY